MGSGVEPCPGLARPLGELIAARGWHLLTGGGRGVMAEVARAFCGVPERAGLSIGVVRSDGYPLVDEHSGERFYRPGPVNRWVEVPIMTHLPLSSQAFESRNHINVLTSDAVVALPGGFGTLSEVHLTLQYGKPVILYLGEPAAGWTIDGKSARELHEESPDPHRVLVAGSLDEVGRHLEYCLGR